MSQDISLISRCSHIAALLKNGDGSAFRSTADFLGEILSEDEVSLLTGLHEFHGRDAEERLGKSLREIQPVGGFLASLPSYTDHEFRVLQEQLAHPRELRAVLDALEMPEASVTTRLMGYIRALYQTRYFDVDRPELLQEMAAEMRERIDHNATERRMQAEMQPGEASWPDAEPADGSGFAPVGKFVRRTGKPQLETLDAPSPHAVVMLPGIDAISNRSYSGALKALVALVADCPEVTAESYVFTTPENARWSHDRALLLSDPGDNYVCQEAREYVEKFILPEILEEDALSAEKLAGFHRQFFGNSFGARFLIRIENALREALDERGISSEQQQRVFERITAVTVSSPDLMYQRTPGAAGFRTLHIFSADDSGTALPSPFLEVTHLENAANRDRPTLYHLPDTPLPGTVPEAGQHTYRNSLLFIPHGQVLPALAKHGERITDRQHNPGNYSAWMAEHPPVMALVQEMLKGPGNGETIATFHQRLDGMLEGLGLESQPLPEHHYVTNAARAERAESRLGNPTIRIARTWVDAIDQSQQATAIAVR